ncbi:exosortase-associated protein EpsI, V-type [Tsuneonella amylolytica]|uniref:exosortase-associated protein EpsI, V-type n=1 Tax=Tsuneonella amylolytica TaxID=2338327 RepID=UPI000EA91C01|nr:exosortase-associated protein EpsI, V-type [Tsuneonella amylolytica]
MSKDSLQATHRTVLFNRRHFFIGGLLVAASGLAFARKPDIAHPIVPSKLFDKWIPQRFGAWSEVGQSGVVLPPPDATRDRLYDNLVTRVYAGSSGPPVMLLLAYNNAQDGVLQVHRPETCYPVGGFALSPTVSLDLPVGNRSVPGTAFTATGPDRTEQVLYFTRLGGDFPRTWVEQRVAVIEANLARQIPDGMLMRVSVLNTPFEIARPQLTRFMQEFFEASAPRLQQLLVG